MCCGLLIPAWHFFSMLSIVAIVLGRTSETGGVRIDAAFWWSKDAYGIVVSVQSDDRRWPDRLWWRRARDRQRAVRGMADYRLTFEIRQYADRHVRRRLSACRPRRRSREIGNQPRWRTVAPGKPTKAIGSGVSARAARSARRPRSSTPRRRASPFFPGIELFELPAIAACGFRKQVARRSMIIG